MKMEGILLTSQDFEMRNLLYVLLILGLCSNRISFRFHFYIFYYYCLLLLLFIIVIVLIFISSKRVSFKIDVCLF